MAPRVLSEPIPLEQEQFDANFTEVTRYHKEAFTYTVKPSNDLTSTAFRASVEINIMYSTRGTEDAWRRQVRLVKQKQRPGPPRLKLRPGIFKCRAYFENIIEDDVEGDGWVRLLKVLYDGRWFGGKVWVPKASIAKEVVKEALKTMEEEANAVESIESPESEVEEARRTVVFTAAPQKGRKHKVEVWRVDGQNGSSSLGNVVRYHRAEDGSKTLTVKVDVEGIKGLLLRGVLPDRMFAARFREVKCLDDE